MGNRALRKEIMSTPYTLRAAQIDLNRQPEPDSFIHEYIDFLAENGYNALQLYIGWRTNINSHPFQVPGGSYNREQIKAIVAAAHAKGLLVIPCTDLTFVQSLIRFPELQDMMETGTRFWGDHRGNFCLSNPKTYEFIENYLTELAELIPSEYFHIGGDEAWDLGFCERCTKDGFDFAKECRMYRDFILKVHSMVVGKLNRTMIMWDDMFEYYPDILQEFPRDIVMAHWIYDCDTSISRGHFGNRRRENTLAKYEQMGFRYLISAATGSSCNARTFTEYAQDGKLLLGGIMTTWVTHRRYMYKAFPAIASAGRLWANGGSEESHYFQALTEILGTDDAALLAAIRSTSEENMPRLGRFTSGMMATFGFEGPYYAAQANRQMCLAILREKKPIITSETGRRIVEDIILTLDIECTAFDLMLEFRRLINGRSSLDAIANLLEAVRKAGKAYAAKWDIWRAGITPNGIDEWLEGFLRGCEKLAAEFASGNILRILFTSPNKYGAVQVTVTAIENGKETILGKQGYRGEQTFFERFIPMPKALRPEAIRISVKGYGGQGLAHVAMRIDGRDIPPASVSTQGNVRDPEVLLDDDCKFAFIGDQDSLKAWHNRALAEKEDSVTIYFKL